MLGGKRCERKEKRRAEGDSGRRFSGIQGEGLSGKLAFEMGAVVFFADGFDGVLKEAVDRVVGKFFDGTFDLAVVVDRGVFDDDAFDIVDELVALLAHFVGEVFVGVRFEVQEDFAQGVEIHDGVLQRSVADVEAAGLSSAGSCVTAELSSLDNGFHDGIAAL